jgi:hypothetical protein
MLRLQHTSLAASGDKHAQRGLRDRGALTRRCACPTLGGARHLAPDLLRAHMRQDVERIGRRVASLVFARSRSRTNARSPIRSQAVEPVTDESDRAPRRPCRIQRFPPGGSGWLLDAYWSSGPIAEVATVRTGDSRPPQARAPRPGLPGVARYRDYASLARSRHRIPQNGRVGEGENLGDLAVAEPVDMHERCREAAPGFRLALHVA